MIKYNVNVCDRIYNEMMIHFTEDCPNNCPFCVDKRNKGIGERKPNLNKIEQAIEKYKDEITDITISGGEPFVYINELLDLVKWVKTNTNLKISIITALPKQCYDNIDMFYKICELVDAIQFSVQHHSEKEADKIRRSKTDFPREILYLEFPFKDKVTISINAVKGYLDTKEDILECVKHYNFWQYKNIKLCEMFDADKYYVDIPKTLGIKMKSPFAHGCKTEYDITKLIPSFDGRLTIKRTCFLRTKCQKASLSDCFKMLTKYIKKKEYFFGVIHEDGTVAPYWI